MEERKDNKEKLSGIDLLALAREQYQEGVDYYTDIWEKAKDDIDFVNGTNHWPEEVLKDREADKRPSLVINLAPPVIRQVVGDQRQNRPQAKFRPVDSGGDPAIAKIYEGLHRNIESISNAKTVQDIAFRHSVANSFGYIRIATEYSDDDSFEQDILYKRVTDPFSVILDPNATDFTHSDGRFAFVTDHMTRTDFKDRFPEATAMNFNEATTNGLGDWFKEKHILVAEYFRRVPITKKLALLSNGETIDVTDRDDIEEGTLIGMDITREPITVVRTKDADSFKVIRYLISGSDVLEKGQDFVSKYIPLVPVWGEEVLRSDGRRGFNSVIRYMKDSNRIYNFMRSAEVEHIALAPKAPWIGTPQQFAGHEAEWDDANKKNRSRLTYNPDPEAGSSMPVRTAPVQANQGIGLGAMSAKEDVKETTGLFDASRGAPSNETSGKAIIARQREGDVSTYVWIDNLTISLTHAARIVLDMIPKVYDTERIIRVQGVDGKEEFVTINRDLPPDQEGNVLKTNDLSVGKYDVVIETGPSYSTQRVEAATAMIEFARAMGPQAASVIGDLVAKNQDWPGASEIGERLKKMLPPGIAEYGEDEKKPEPPQPPPPTPAEELESQSLEVEAQKVAVEGQKVALDEKKLELEFEELKVKAMEIQGKEGLNEDEVRELIIKTMIEANNRTGEQ